MSVKQYNPRQWEFYFAIVEIDVVSGITRNVAVILSAVTELMIRCGWSSNLSQDRWRYQSNGHGKMVMFIRGCEKRASDEFAIDRTSYCSVTR